MITEINPIQIPIACLTLTITARHSGPVLDFVQANLSLVTYLAFTAFPHQEFGPNFLRRCLFSLHYLSIIVVLYPLTLAMCFMYC